MISLPVEEDAFLTWFAETSARDAAMIWEKAKQYGGFDLQANALAVLRGAALVPGTAVDDLVAAVAFNASQKLARIIEAIGRGEEAADDSWRDLCCYAMVARRIREVGTWPA